MEKKYYDGIQIHKILNEELDDGKTIMRIMQRFAEEPSARPEIINCKDCRWYKTIFSWNGTPHYVCVKDPCEPVREPDFFCDGAERKL